MNVFCLFSYTFLSLFLPVSHKYCNVLLCPDAEDSNLATTLWILQLNQPIREQLNQELAGTRAVDAHSSCSHPKVRGHDMNLILYVWWVSSVAPMCSSTAPAECLYPFILHLPLFTPSVSFSCSASTHPECLHASHTHTKKMCTFKM